MSYVQLEPDGLYLYRYNSDTTEYDKNDIDPDIVWTHLREECKIAEGTTLGNIFDTVDKYPLLKAFIAQYSWCKSIDEFHAQAKLLPPKDELDKLTYLEVYHHVSNHKDDFDIGQGFHGIGLKQPDGDNQIMEVTPYSVSYSPMNELAHLPVKLNTEVKIYEPIGGPKSKSSSKSILESERCFSLLEVLDAIYDDISFMGGPDDNKEFLEELHEVKKDIDERLERGEQVGIPWDEFKKELEDNNNEKV